MRNNDRKTSRVTEGDGEALKALSKRLQHLCTGSGLSQRAIEDATGVDQTTVSRAKNGKLKRVTEKVQLLNRYAIMRKKSIVLPKELNEAAIAFLHAGGQEKELLAFIRDATRLVIRHVPTDT